MKQCGLVEKASSVLLQSAQRLLKKILIFCKIGQLTVVVLDLLFTDIFEEGFLIAWLVNIAQYQNQQK